MTEISPQRRRMIEDMAVRNLSPATQRSYEHASPSSAASLAARLTGWIWRTLGFFRFI
jgi:hypothetical protein